MLYFAPEVGTSDLETRPYCVLLVPPAAETIAEGLHLASRTMVAQASAAFVIVADSLATTYAVPVYAVTVTVACVNAVYSVNNFVLVPGTKT